MGHLSETQLFTWLQRLKAIHYMPPWHGFPGCSKRKEMQLNTTKLNTKKEDSQAREGWWKWTYTSLSKPRERALVSVFWIIYVISIHAILTITALTHKIELRSCNAADDLASHDTLARMQGSSFPLQPICFLFMCSIACRKAFQFVMGEDYSLPVRWVLSTGTILCIRNNIGDETERVALTPHTGILLGAAGLKLFKYI